MNNARGVCLMAGLFLLAAPVATEATTVRGFSMRDMVREAAVVVRGKIQSQKAVWARNNTIIVTESKIRIIETLVGNKAPRVITVRQLGGTVGETSMHVTGVAPLKKGHQVLLFLRTNGKHHFLVGMAQGHYRVVVKKKKTVLTRDLGTLNLIGKLKPVGHSKVHPKEPEQLYSTFAKQILGYAKELGRVR